MYKTQVWTEEERKLCFSACDKIEKFVKEKIGSALANYESIAVNNQTTGLTLSVEKNSDGEVSVHVFSQSSNAWQHISDFTVPQAMELIHSWSELKMQLVETINHRKSELEMLKNFEV